MAHDRSAVATHPLTRVPSQARPIGPLSGVALAVAGSLVVVGCQGTATGPDLGRETRAADASGRDGGPPRGSSPPDAVDSSAAPPRADAGSEDAGVVDAMTVPPADAGSTSGEFETRVPPCDSPNVYDVTPSNIGTYQARAADECVVLNLGPGTYTRLNPSRLGHLTYRCAEPHQCVIERINPTYIDTLIVEDVSFTASNEDYAISAYYIEAMRVENCRFEGSYTHDISTKNIVDYMEVLNNEFIRCERHCLELGQNGNIRSRPSVSGTAIVWNNRFESPQINAITQRANRLLIVDSNEFINVSGRTVTNWPYWQKYPFGASDDDGTLYIPEPPLRTEITDNTFVGSTTLSFEGRGVRNDTLLISSNDGAYSCSRSRMADSTAAATADEETRDPPSMDPNSDPCP